MLFKHKLISIMILYLIFALDISIIYFVRESKDMLLKAEYVAAHNEQVFLDKNINEMLKDVNSQESPAEYEDIKKVIDMYKMFYGLNDIELELVSEYSDIEKDKSEIVITKTLSVPNQEYIFVYRKSLKNLYSILSHWKRIFFFINIFFAFIIFLTMINLKRLMNPLDEILLKINDIKNKNYSTPIDVKTKDEFGKIAEEFNSLSDSIRSTVSELEKAIAEKQMLADNMAHELKNPLTSIKGFSEYLLKGNVDSKNRTIALEYIYNETERLQRLCNKILKIAIMKNETLSLESVNTEEICEEIKKIEAARLDNKNIKLIFNSKLENLYADKELLVSLLLNLIDNSINASSPGSVILVYFYKEDNNACIKIKDNGTGIDEKYITDILQPFFRIDKARSRENGGAGLGLALCKSIIDLHGGNISITSKPGYGTEVLIFLPLFYKNISTL